MDRLGRPCGRRDGSLKVYLAQIDGSDAAEVGGELGFELEHLATPGGIGREDGEDAVPAKAETSPRSAMARPQATGQAAARRSRGVRPPRLLPSAMRSRSLIPSMAVRDPLELYCPPDPESAEGAMTETAAGEDAEHEGAKLGEEAFGAEGGGPGLDGGGVEGGLDGFKARDGAGERGSGLLREVEAGGRRCGGANGLKRAAGTEGDHGPAAGLGFERHHAEVFIGGEEQGAGGGVLVPERVGGELAEEGDLGVRGGLGSGEALEAFELGAGADDAKLPAEALTGLDHELGVFVGDEPAGGEVVGADGTQATAVEVDGAGGGRRFRGRTSARCGRRRSASWRGSR